MFVEFGQPGYFALVAILPVIVLLTRRSLAALGTVRRKLAVGLRCLVVVVLIVALADPQWVRTTDDQTVVFALDTSGSIPGWLENEALGFINAATKTMRPGKDLVAGVGFAGRPSVWQLPKSGLTTDRLPPATRRHETNIASVLKLGLGLFPAQTSKRLVLISDGNENRAVSSEVAQTYAALGIPIDVLPLQYEHQSEIIVERLSAPATANRDEVIDLQLFIRSQLPTAAHLRLYHNDRLVDLDESSEASSLPIHLDAGANRYAIPVQLPTSGVHRFTAVISPDDKLADTMAINNQGSAFTIVGQAERVLIVAGSSSQSDREGARVLAEALRKGGIEVEQISLHRLPADPASLADCSTLILCNVSAFALGENLQKMIASFVRDQGGGLVVIGGDQSFSVGGYAHTTLEEVLPVETDRDKLKLLSLAMVIVIDRSGSMSGEKLAMARQAAMGAVQLLGPLDRIGVIAFDSMPECVVPIRTAADRTAIARMISTIAGGGGTNMFPALEQAYAALLPLDANLKHVIVLTDGKSVHGDFEALAGKCCDAGITVSTIAVGPDADRALLARIATLSQGRMYTARSAQPLPQIFVHETVLASTSGLYERPFTPRLDESDNERIMVGFSQSDIPALRGHVVASAKPAASVPLFRPTDEGSDPILAYWQEGLGRAVAFTSGLWNHWAPQWVAWPSFSKLWTQVVRYAGRSSNASDLEVESSVKNGVGHVVVSAEYLPRELQTSLELTGRLIQPDYSSKPLHFERTASGRLEADFSADLPGTYLVNMAYSQGEGRRRHSGTLRTGIVVSFSKEYATMTHDDTTLAGLARKTGGRVLSAQYPDMVFERSSIRPVQIRRSVWELLVKFALGLFLLDVAVRRLAVTPAELFQKLTGWTDGLGAREVAAKSVATLAALRESHSQTRESGKPPTDQPQRRDEQVNPDCRANRPARQSGYSIPQTHRPTTSTPSERGPASASDESHTSRLLKVKKRLDNESDAGSQS